VVLSEKIVIKGLQYADDVKIITCAVAGKADYIVTGDKDLLVLKEYKGIRIVTPKTFSDILK